MQNKGHEIINAIFQAKDYRPDGIVTPDQFRDVITVDEQASSVTYPYSALNEILKGLRKKEAGHSLCWFWCWQVHLHKGTYLSLDAIWPKGWGNTAGRVREAHCWACAIHMNKNVLVDRASATDEEILAGFDDLFGGEEQNLLFIATGLTGC